MPGTTPPDPWHLYVDLYDLVAGARDFAAVQAILTSEEAMSEKARAVADAIDEAFAE